MKIILVRHGDYTPKQTDPSEGLSEKGNLEVKALLNRLKNQNITFDKIYASPKKRAQQTAIILAEGKSIETTDLLTWKANPNNIKDHIAYESGTILLVGHNPFMGELASIFGINTHFGTAGCLLIENSTGSTI